MPLSKNSEGGYSRCRSSTLSFKHAVKKAAFPPIYLYIGVIMARECEFCNKKTQVGIKYARRGLAKSKGGVGRKITGKTKRKFHPNLQKIRAVVNGSVRRVRVCTRCLKSGKVQKPSPRDLVQIMKGATAEAS